MLGAVFEAAMLLCFAAAWPANIWKAWNARTAVGTSLPFMLIIEVGYICGMLNKVVSDDIDAVIAFYVFDFCLVLVGILIYLRNVRLDRAAEAGKAR